jgi:hypothetical protein
MARALTEKQQKLLAVLFDEAGGDIVAAKKIAGYSDATSSTEIINSLKEEILDATSAYMARNAPKAAMAMVGALYDPTELWMKMTKPLKQWKLPQPTDIKEDNEWVPIPRISRTIPFGYEVNPDDPDVLLPIDHELDMLEQAQRYLKQYSYREVANWLTRNTGRDISHVGLRKRLENERRRKNKAASLRRWADYAKKAIAKAEEIERTRLGAKAQDDYEEEYSEAKA